MGPGTGFGPLRPAAGSSQVKVVLVTFRFDAFGGAVAVVRTLARALSERGLETVVVASREAPGLEVRHEGPVKIYSFRPPNLYWVGNKDRQPSWRKIVWQTVDTWNPFVVPTVRRILEIEHPDVVHVHKLRGLSPSVWSAAVAAGAPKIVQTCHDYELMSPEGTLSGQIGDWARRGAVPLWPYQTIRRRVSKAVDVATAPTRFPLDLIRDLGFFPEAIHRAVPNSHGLTLEEVRARRARTVFHPGSDPTRLLFLGRLDRVKGVELLCRSFVETARDRPTLELWIAGWGPLERSLRERFEDHPRIRFWGRVEGRVKERVLADCSAVVVPSSVPETFGLVIAEAYTFGKPVIASRIGGVPELVAEGRTGLLVKPGSQVELSAGLQQVDENPGLLFSMREACLAAASDYTIESVVDGYLDLYRGSARRAERA